MISNRRDLETAVLQILEATVDEEFKALVPQWVDAGLDDVFSRMRASWAVRSAFNTIADGVVLLPPSYLEMMTVLADGYPDPLVPLAPDQVATLIFGTGPIQGYLIEGNQLTLVPIPSDGFRCRFTYFSKLDPLDAPESTNAYVRNASTALLYAAAAYGAFHRQDVNMAGVYQQVAAARVDAINEEAGNAMYGPGITMQRTR